ncbi:MAG: serine/threonine-protein kinase [Gemmatimonadetes bacterium]|nr:serine/threonine-protein kinase [Gemmatimonadota bacterium]
MPDLLERLAAALAGRYTVERELGTGGMATVYLAHDLKHNRKVALKVLRPELAAALGHDRFLREIEIAAGLSHPHILPLYDSGRAEVPPGEGDAAEPSGQADFLFYVMPFVEGESLRDRIRREKQLPLEDAMRMAREVADALSYAHSRGVVHRDIKPENIMLQSGHAVVADFGIARAVDVAGGDRLTGTGVTLGTPTYMSPEQAAGDTDLDGRSDLYALACVLYEMLAGQPPFTGATAQSVIAQHLTADPRPITQLRPAVPDEVAGVLQRALAKNPADRFNPVAQFADALGQPVGAEAPRTRRPNRWLVPTLVSAVVIAVGAVGALLLRGRPTRLVMGATTQVTLDPGLEIDPDISPDGSMVAYAAGPPTAMQIYVRQVSGGRTVRLTDDTTMTHRWPRWSPDGTQVAYEAEDGTISAVPALGGPPRLLVRLPPDSVISSDPLAIMGFDWSPDGKRLVYIRGWPLGAIYMQTVGEGAPTLLTTVSQANSPAWSPDGARIAVAVGNPIYVFGTKYFANEGQTGITVVPLDEKPPIAIVAQSDINISPAWMPDGRSLLWVSSRDGTRDVYRVSVSRSSQAGGAPERVTTGLDAFSISVSRDGGRLAYASLATSSNVWSVDIPKGEQVSSSTARPITRGNQTVETANVSPDGMWLAFDSDRGGDYDIWKMPVAGGEPVQLTTDPAGDFAPAWSPDGTQLSFHSLRNGNRDVYTMAADGTGLTQRTSSPDEDLDTHWSPDGKALVFQRVNDTSDVLRVRSLADGSGHDVWRGEYARWSPKGDEIAAAAPDGLRVGPAEGGPSRLLVPRPDENSGPYMCAWSPDARTVYYLYRGRSGWSVRAIAPTGGESRVLVTFDDSEREPSKYGFSTDGQRFYLTLGRRESDVWVATLKKR